MRLPQVSYADGIKTAKQDEFAGLNHNLGAKDGEPVSYTHLTLPTN